jgi:glycosyltransferase involved in cell wall biosynthesis
MTTYNGEKFLKEQLDGMLVQSRPVDELVVCDDGSADGTVNMLDAFSRAAPFPVRIVKNKKNLGSTKNFEQAISLCGGDIVVLCDQDDVWLPDKISALEGIFSANANCLMAFTNAMVTDEANNPQRELWSCFGFDERRQRMLRDGRGFIFFVRGNVVTGATAAIKKSFFEETAPFPQGLVHDHWLAAAAALKNGLSFSRAITVNYRKHPSQQLGTPPEKNLRQKINGVFDYDKAVESTRIMLRELDERYSLTEKQRKMFLDKIKFYQFRKNLPPCRLKRAPKIAANLLSGNYHNFSLGLLSMAKDLARK